MYDKLSQVKQKKLTVYCIVLQVRIPFKKHKMPVHTKEKIKCSTVKSWWLAIDLEIRFCWLVGCV